MRSGTACGWWRLCLFSVILVLIGAAALAQDNAAAEGAPAAGGAGLSDGVTELWKGMFDAGMIDHAQYQYVLQNGHLPGGSTVQNSPVASTKQSLWQGLAEKKVITPEELANMLFKGTIPNLTEAERKAFEELASVYEPDRSKRLTYDIRRKHQRVDLIRLQHRLSEERTNRLAVVYARAQREGVPIEIVRPDGERCYLEDFEHGIPVYQGPLNAISAQTISTDRLQGAFTNGFSLSGTNVIIGMWDAGNVRLTHQEFSTNRLFQMEGGSDSYHATAVAGTLAAAGVQAEAKGMAPSATVHIRGSGGSLSELAAAIASTEMHVSNHSYGNQFIGWWFILPPPFGWWMWSGDLNVSTTEDPKFSRYNGNSRTVDEVVYDGIYHLPVWAAGNERSPMPSQPVDHKVYVNGQWVITNMLHDADGSPYGYDTLLDYQTAKNALIVGAVEDVPGGYSNAASVFPTSFSSFGPTDDGRIKPDIVANGAGLYSADDDSDSDYQSLSGTSFSSPSAAGSVALLIAQHNAIYGTNAPLLASTLRAVVIHTASECGPTLGPDYSFGWGLMDSLNAAVVITNNAAWDSLPHIKEVALSDGAYVEFDVLASTNEPLKVTMAWTDPPGPEQPYAVDPTNLVLVNDLDLRVIAPDGGTNFPWVLDPQNPTNAATTGDNFRDNVEQIVIPDPTNDWYTVRVTHKGSLSNGLQDVSIIVTGNTPTNAPDFLITAVGVAETNGPIQIEWPGVVGALYAVETCTNLLVAECWTNLNSTISANLDLMDWIDTESTNHWIRFYRLKRLR